MQESETSGADFQVIVLRSVVSPAMKRKRQPWSQSIGGRYVEVLGAFADPLDAVALQSGFNRASLRSERCSLWANVYESDSQGSRLLDVDRLAEAASA